MHKFCCSQAHSYHVIVSWPWNLKQGGIQLRNWEPIPFTNRLICFFNNIFYYWKLTPWTALVTDVRSSFCKISTPFSHTAIPHKVAATNITHLMMNFPLIMSFSKKNANCKAQLTKAATAIVVDMFPHLLLSNDWFKELCILICVGRKSTANLHSSITSGSHPWLLKG